MNNYLMIIACLFIISSQSVTAEILSMNSGGNDFPIVIHYGFNDSHSRCWAQVDRNGLVGITFFQRFVFSGVEGCLIYQTIHQDGTTTMDTVTRGTRLEKSVLLFDSLDQPHIFTATSTDDDQIVDHYYKNGDGHWQAETIIHFYNEGGKFIYELSADRGPDYSFHLLILKTRSNVDSDDYMNAWLNSYLYHLTNKTGSWVKVLVNNYNMAYTYDHYIKSSSRQDIKVDKNGFVHVVFSEQINATDDPSRLWYATNKSGSWVREIALNYDYGIRDDAGWFPSLALDSSDTPYISCMYVNRVYTRSAVYCKLLLLKRLGNNAWQSETIAQQDDGYYGNDGRNYTGGLSHLVFDDHNTPHIIFTDIASSHWGYNRLNVGNIRYGVFENGFWNIKTIYRQPLPTGFFSATEMYGMCLLISGWTDTIRIIGQELTITGENIYTGKLLYFSTQDSSAMNYNESDHASVQQFKLYQNYPNPFNPATTITYDIPVRSYVRLDVYNVLGVLVKTIVSDVQEAGSYSMKWNGVNNENHIVSSGLYLLRLKSGTSCRIQKALLLK